MPYATALTSIEDGRIEMCTQNAFRFWDRIAYDEHYGGVALSNDEGDRMCRALGDKDILFLRNHGVIVSGRPSRRPTTISTISSARRWCRCWRCRPAGRCTISTRRWPRTRPARSPARAQQALLHFESLKRLLDRDEPGWRRLAA